MNKVKHILFFSTLLLLIPLGSIAQTDSLEVHQINGKDYYIHIVEKGQSLYFIHKKYNVPLEVIKKENPSVEDGLSIGEKIFIPLKKDIEVEIKTDGNYINHEVKKQQTLYSIANLYQVTQMEIIAANPEIADGLKEGQIIKIPVSNIKQNDIDNNSKPQYKTHVVKAGETLYSLSKLYNTSIDSIKMVNDGLKQGLRVNEVIYIPLKVENATATSITNIRDKVEEMAADTLITKKNEYVIGLLLPFYLDENDEITEHRSAIEEKMIYPKSKFAIEFYNGFIMALDSISTDSCKFKVHVYDTKGNDSLRIKNILLKPELKTLDLMVGPLYYDNFKQAVEFAQKNHIPIVSPVKQNNKTLLGNEFVFKAIPSKSSIVGEISTLAIDSFKTDNLMAIEYEKAKEKPLVDLFIKAYNDLLLTTKDTGLYSSVKKLNINTNISEVVSNLKGNKNNVIFVPTSNQTFVTSLFNYLSTTLNKREYEDYKVTLIGLEEWMDYENIDLEYFQQLNVHFCSSQYVNYKDSLTNMFIKDYVMKKETYPSLNTFLGFDLGYYFGNNLKDQGSLFVPASLVDYKGMSIQLHFFKTGVESGYENTHSYMMRFNDYVVESVPH